MTEPGGTSQTLAAIAWSLWYSGGMCLTRRRVTMLGFVAIVGALSVTSTAIAQESDPISEERRDAARRLFEQGERAYEAGDYRLAAQAFDEAYRVTPHYASLWNAARAWDRAQERSRAANAYAKYLRVAPPDAPDRDAATAALATLAQHLGRIEVYAVEMDAVRVNDEVLEGTSIYVNQGTHIVEGQTGDTKIKRTEEIKAGEVRSVALVREKPESKIEIPVKPSFIEQAILPSSSMVAVAPRSLSNRRPAWYGTAAIVTGGLTAVSGAFLFWSGMDTLSARKDFDALPTADKLETGKEKQLRTNLLIGATAASGIATGVFLSLWKWNGSTTNAAVTVLPSMAGFPTQLWVAGSF